MVGVTAMLLIGYGVVPLTRTFPDESTETVNVSPFAVATKSPLDEL